MTLFYSILGGREVFMRTSKKKRKTVCIFFEAGRREILKKHIESRGRGSAENTALDKIKMGERQKFRAGLCAWVEFTGVPEEKVPIDGDQYLKIRVVSEEAIVYCYSEITEGECFCLELVA